MVLAEPLLFLEMGLSYVQPMAVMVVMVLIAAMVVKEVLMAAMVAIMIWTQDQS